MGIQKVAFSVVFLFVAVGTVNGRPTNVVLFLIDDLGWMDLGCQGGDYYRTPNIDKLAGSGVRFTDAYAAAHICSPTRAAILTGKYPARLMLTQWLPAGRWVAKKHRLREGRYLRALPLEEVTLAETLHEAGYATGFVGKWHLGGEPFYMPRHQGFDVNVGGSDHGAPGHYFFPYKGEWLIPTTGLRVEKQTLPDGEPGEYLTDRLTDEAISFIRGRKDKPFLLMLSHYAVHAPLQAKRDMIAKYEKIPKAKRRGKPAYAAMVESVDQSVGRVMGTLAELGLADDTLVIFTSDNGGWAGGTDNSPLRANKGSSYEGGIRVPLLIRWPGVTDEGKTSSVPAISNDLYPTILETLGLKPAAHQHVDGVSLGPALKGERLPERNLYWHYPHYNRHPSSAPAGVVRSGDWKLIELFETGKRELYNLSEDVGESKDLASAEPRKAAELASALQRWREQVGADGMKPNPLYEPSP